MGMAQSDPPVWHIAHLGEGRTHEELEKLSKGDLIDLLKKESELGDKNREAARKSVHDLGKERDQLERQADMANSQIVETKGKLNEAKAVVEAELTSAYPGRREGISGFDEPCTYPQWDATSREARYLMVLQRKLGEIEAHCYPIAADDQRAVERRRY